MEIRNWNWYIVINCAFLTFLAAKPFSLNEALAAESKLKSSHVSSSFSTEPAAQRFSLNKNFGTENPKKIKFEKQLHQKLSPLKHSKSYQIKSPSKSKKARNFLKPFSSRRSFSKKRDTHKNDKKYFPILKNLGELLNNLLNSQPIESNEITNTKQKRHKYESEAKRGIVCKCALQSDSDTRESRAYKKTAVPAAAVSAESAATTPPAPHTTVGDVSGLRQNKDLSLLLPRDPASNRRDSHGHSEGSRATLHGSFERNLPGHFRNSKHYTRLGDEESYTQGHEKVTHGHPRDYASSDEYGRQNRGNGNLPIGRGASKRKTFEEDYKTNRIFGRDSIEEHSRENQFKVRRNQTKSEKFIQKHVRRSRRPIPEVEDGDIAESIQSKEYYEKSFNDVSFDNTSDKRIASGSGPSTTEAKEASATNEDMISLKDLSNLKLALHKSPQKLEAPSVTIIDGYSVARDKNGQNKLSEKTIHIHT